MTSDRSPVQALGLALLLTPAAVAFSPSSDLESRPPVNLPQQFIEKEDGFVMLGDGLAASLEIGRVRWTIGAADGSARVVIVEPVGGRADVAPVGEELRPGVVNRFRGQPEQWEIGRKTFGAVRYAGLWEGIDLRLEADGDTLKGTYVVAPGADPGDVRMRHRGGDSVRIDDEGRLVVHTTAGDLVDDAPVAWQEIGGESVEVPVAFALEEAADGDVDVLFDVGDHDPGLPLLIDPAVVVQSGFLGGIDTDQVADIAVDSSGNLYIAGFTRSTEATFPVTNGPDLTWSGPFPPPHGDAFVAKLDPTGETLLYAGFVGGGELDYATGLAVDSLGRAYISGYTKSTESSFPVTVGPDATYNIAMDGFVARVAADGSSLEYCGYIGGNSEDRALGIAVDDLFRAYVVGRFESFPPSLPLLNGPALTAPGGSSDAFAARVSPSGASLEYCGYIGGSSHEDATGVAVDSLGGAWVTGWTLSTDLPVLIGPDLTHNGGVDVFIAHVTPTGTALQSLGYLGGAANDFAYGTAVGPSGSLYLAGFTHDATNFPAIVGPDLVPAGTGDGFITRVNANALGFGWSGFTGTGYSATIDVDAAEQVWVLTAVDDGPAGGRDVLVGTVPPSGSELEPVATFGGPADDGLSRICLVPSAVTPGVTEFWLGGSTTLTETELPVVTGPDVTQNGGLDAIVVRMQVAPDPWFDLGFAKAGTHGDPVLTGGGTLGPNSPFSLSLTNALENTTAWLALGYSPVFAPFMGGTFVPNVAPPGSLTPLPTGAAGEIVLSGNTPPALPSGLSIFVQYWIQDPGGLGPAVSASNALRGTTP